MRNWPPRSVARSRMETSPNPCAARKRPELVRASLAKPMPLSFTVTCTPSGVAASRTSASVARACLITLSLTRGYVQRCFLFRRLRDVSVASAGHGIARVPSEVGAGAGHGPLRPTVVGPDQSVWSLGGPLPERAVQSPARRKAPHLRERGARRVQHHRRTAPPLPAGRARAGRTATRVAEQLLRHDRAARAQCDALLEDGTATCRFIQPRVLDGDRQLVRDDAQRLGIIPGRTVCRARR